jgi:hypothetical protein
MTISSLMEWITSDIEEDMSDIIDDEDEYMYLDTARRIGGRESREYRFLSDTLDGRYARESRSRRGSLDDDIFSTAQIVTPLYRFAECIECIEVSDPRLGETQIDAIGKSAPYEELIHIRQGSATLDYAVLPSDICEVELLTLATYE